MTISEVGVRGPCPKATLKEVARPREEDLQGYLKKKKTFKDDTGHYKSCEGGAQARYYKQSLEDECIEDEGVTYSPLPLYFKGKFHTCIHL